MKLSRRRFVAVSAAFGWVVAGRHEARAAASFPERPLVLIDPATAGSSTDYFLRPLAEEMSKLLGQPVIVENKPGAGGSLAAEYVARAKPDGYTLGLAAVSTHAANPALNRSLRYDPIKDFAPITMMVTLPSATVVRADSTIRTLTDLIETARSKPGAVSFASPGVGSAGHVLMEQFANLVGVKFLHVPYRGSSGILSDLIGGQITVASDNIPALLPHISSGVLRPLVVRNLVRLSQLPEVPTFKELGFEELSYPLWFGLVAPAGTPDELISRLNSVAQAAMRKPSFQQRVEAGAATYSPSTPAQFEEQILRWFARFKTVVELAKIKPE
jgi:tripartite-type tricarboxylate transporter receptor subunit TctC